MKKVHSLLVLAGLLSLAALFCASCEASDMIGTVGGIEDDIEDVVEGLQDPKKGPCISEQDIRECTFCRCVECIASIASNFIVGVSFRHPFTSRLTSLRIAHNP